jgi:hypothetical protein
MERDRAVLYYTKHPDLDFTCFVSKGETTIENWLQTVSNYGAEGMTTRELYDLRGQTNLFSNNEIGEILDVALKNRAIHKNKRKTAIVVDSVPQFGLSRMYELKSQVEGVLTKTRVFYRLDEVVEWLGDDVAGCIFELRP